MKLLVILFCGLSFAYVSSSNQWIPKTKRGLAVPHGLVNGNDLSAHVVEAPQALQYLAPALAAKTAPQYAPQPLPFLSSSLHHPQQLLPPLQPPILRSSPLQDEPSVDLQSTPLPLPPQLLTLPLPSPAPVHHHLVHAPQEHVHVQQQLLPPPQQLPIQNVAVQTQHYPTQVIQTAALPGPSVATLTLQDLENIRAYLLGPNGHASLVTESRVAIAPVAQDHITAVPVQHNEVQVQALPQVQVHSVPLKPVHHVHPASLPQVEAHSAPLAPVHHVHPAPLQHIQVHSVSPPVSLQQLQVQRAQLHAAAQSHQQQSHAEAQLEAEAQVQSQLHQVVEARRIQPSPSYLPVNH